MEEREKKGFKKLGGETMKKRFLTMSIVMLAVIVTAFSAPASAYWAFDGYELKTMTNGTIQGDVYVGGGHGAPTLVNNENPENPYNQTFEVPGAVGSNGENVTWARLYVGVWGGTETDCGWLNVTFTNNTGTPTTLDNVSLGFPETTCDGDQDDNPVYNTTVTSAYNSGHGCWLVALNCTSNVTSGTNTANATTIGGTIDGRVYGIVLVVVYENTSSAKVQYWVNEGNVNLHYAQSQFFPELNNNVTWFNGTAYNSTEANLTVVYYTGDSNQNDYLFLNAPNDASDSPGNVSNDNIGWDNGSSYWKYQLDNKNVANSRSDNCSVNYSDTHCDCSGPGCCGCRCNCSSAEQYISSSFDFNCFSQTNDSTPLKDIINHTANNYAIFWRGHDDNGNGTIDGGWNATNAEGEIYLHPILAVLVLKNITHDYDFGSKLTGTPGEDAWAFKFENNSKPPTTCDVPNTEFSSTDYDEIEADDGTSQYDESEDNFAAHRFNFSIDEAAADIDKINVTWNGKGWHDNENNGATLYIWKDGTGYEQLDSNSVSTDATLTGERASSISNYINSGNVTILVEQNTKESGSISYIETDYVKLVVTL